MAEKGIPGNADPAFDAERRAIQRGLEDLLQDTKTARKDIKKDWRTTSKDIRLDKKRGMKDLGRELERGLLSARQQREDVRTDRSRGREDFATRLTDLGRQFTQQGFNQGQAINAGGGMVNGGQARASAIRREENMAYERKPLDTALARMEEDAATQLGRIDIATGQLRQDTNIAQRRLKQDSRHDLRLGRRDVKRDIRDIHRERQRGKREATISRADLLKQAVWAANRS